jgi:hypothetical protein
MLGVGRRLRIFPRRENEEGKGDGKKGVEDKGDQKKKSEKSKI